MLKEICSVCNINRFVCVGCVCVSPGGGHKNLV